MTEKDFEHSKISLQIINIILKHSSRANGETAFRLVNKTATHELTIEDFIPTFMENFNKETIQEKTEKKEIEFFGLSMFYSYEKMMDFRKFIPKLKKRVASVGYLDSNKGGVGKKDKNTHFQFYLFDPKNLNPYNDFHLINNEGGEKQ